MLTTKTKKYILMVGALVLSIPVHEWGHHIVAEIDGAQIHKINYFCEFNGTHFINPSITVNEYTFSSLWALILYNLGGFLATFVPGLLITVVLYLKKTSIWKYPYMWVLSAPLVSLSDFDRALELLCLNDVAKWVHVGLGVSTTLMLVFIRRKLKK